MSQAVEALEEPARAPTTAEWLGIPPGTKLEIWSCDPASIPPWTEDDKQRLTGVLADVFGWPNEPVDETQVSPQGTD